MTGFPDRNGIETVGMSDKAGFLVADREKNDGKIIRNPRIGRHVPKEIPTAGGGDVPRGRTDMRRREIRKERVSGSDLVMG